MAHIRGKEGDRLLHLSAVGLVGREPQRLMLELVPDERVLCLEDGVVRERVEAEVVGHEVDREHGQPKLARLGVGLGVRVV